jgi:ubiquinone/menaquinone biosynthesis C-methylase UbiE
MIAVIPWLVLTAAVQGQRFQPISTDEIVTALAVRPSGTVCEIGAGDGALSLEISQRLGPAAHVVASELGERRIASLRHAVDTSRNTRVTVVAAGELVTGFPDGSCDAVLLKDVYHHLSNPAAINAAIFSALKPSGRVVVVDFTPPGKEAPRPVDRGNDGMHGVLPTTVERELTAVGFVTVESNPGDDRRWFVIVMSKPSMP